jgi:hypothetical protein
MLTLYSPGSQRWWTWWCRGIGRWRGTMIQTGAVKVEATVRDTHGQTQVVVLGYRICGGGVIKQRSVLPYCCRRNIRQLPIRASHFSCPRDCDKRLTMLGSRFALRSTNCRALRPLSRNLANLTSVRRPALVQYRSFNLIVCLIGRSFGPDL